MKIAVTINGERREADVWAGESLLNALRDDFGLPGSKNACEQGECGSCSVLLDGELVCACLVLAAQADGHEVTTVEGLRDGEELHRVQRAFVEAGAVQCGFCTPGLVVATAALLERVPSPSDDEIREALSGNLCRCTGYAKIFDAVRLAASAVTTTPDPQARARPRRRGRAPQRRRAQGGRRVRLLERPPRGRDALGQARCEARTRTRASSRSTPRPPSACRACTPCSRTRTCRGRRPTASSSPTSRCSRSSGCATSARRSRSSPPRSPSRRGVRPPPSGSSTSRSSRSPTWSAPPSRSRSIPTGRRCRTATSTTHARTSCAT